MQQKLYPIEYAEPTHPEYGDDEGIVASHSLIPDALYHGFAAFGALIAMGFVHSRAFYARGSCSSWARLAFSPG